MWDNFIYYGKINQNRDSHKCTDGAVYKKLCYLAVVGVLIATGKRTKRKNMYSYRKLATSILSALTIILKL